VKKCQVLSLNHIANGIKVLKPDVDLPGQDLFVGDTDNNS
jgi:hypothetical protein